MTNPLDLAPCLINIFGKETYRCFWWPLFAELQLSSDVKSLLANQQSLPLLDFFVLCSSQKAMNNILHGMRTPLCVRTISNKDLIFRNCTHMYIIPIHVNYLKNKKE